MSCRPRCNNGILSFPPELSLSALHLFAFVAMRLRASSSVHQTDTHPFHIATLPLLNSLKAIVCIHCCCVALLLEMNIYRKQLCRSRLSWLNWPESTSLTRFG